jgi:hypothetical protein
MKHERVRASRAYVRARARETVRAPWPPEGGSQAPLVVRGAILSGSTTIATGVVCRIERASTPRTVAAYQAAPPWAGGTPAWFRSFAIARSERRSQACFAHSVREPGFNLAQECCQAVTRHPQDPANSGIAPQPPVARTGVHRAEPRAPAARDPNRHTIVIVWRSRMRTSARTNHPSSRWSVSRRRARGHVHPRKRRARRSHTGRTSAVQRGFCACSDCDFRATRLAYAMCPKNSPASERRRASALSSSAASTPIRPVSSSASAPRSRIESM